MAKNKIRLADVAEQAGVAVSTVSRVVNGSPLVSADLRKQIEQIIASLGYRPAPIEKRKGVIKEPWPWLKHRLFRTVLVGPYDSLWITNYAPIYSYALHGVDDQLRRFQLQHAVDRAETDSALIKMLKQGGADGYLILNAGAKPLPVEIAAYPVAVFMGSHNHLTCDRVVPNSRAAGNLAADYLRSKGCCVGIAIGGISPVYRERTDAFRARLAEHGIGSAEMEDAAIIRGGPREHQANRAALLKQLIPLLAGKPKPIGVFSITDIVTPAIYAGLEAEGLRIGTDVHVVSCNNERPYLDQLHPQPAVIDTHADYIGRRAARQLLHRLEFFTEPREKILIEPSLVVPEHA